MTLPIRRKRLSSLWDTPMFGDVFFDRLFGEWPVKRGFAEEILPAMNFSEKEGNYLLTVEVPGVNKEALDISIEQGILSVKGKKEEKTEDKGDDYYLKEVTYGSFSRSLRLPSNADAEKVEADMTDGVLTITIPKKAEAAGKKVEIK